MGNPRLPTPGTNPGLIRQLPEELRNSRDALGHRFALDHVEHDGDSGRHDQRLRESPLMVSDVTHRRNLRVCLALVGILGATLLLSSCAAGGTPSAGTGEEPAGFWLGLWHGIILPVTFVISLSRTT